VTLRLVRDEPPKAPTKRRKGERRPVLTADEEKRFRAAMRGLEGAFGSWSCLAAAMDVDPGALRRMMRGSASVSGEMVVKAMKASGLSLADLLGGPVLATRCRACGAVKRAA